MSVGQYTLRKTYVDGQILSASDYVADNQQHATNNDPDHIGAHSDNVSTMRTLTDPGDVSSESLATTLSGEIERMRFVLKEIKDRLNGSAVAQWYAKSWSIVTPTTQYLQSAVSAQLAVGTSDTTIQTQAITMTRTRCRVVVEVGGFGQFTASGVINITLKIKRDGTTIYTGPVISMNAHTLADVLPFSAGGFVVDTTTAAAHSYTVTVAKDTAASVTLQAAAVITLEELA